MNLYRFYADCGRMGELDGLFIEDEYVVQTLYGKKIYFGEVLGKHSEIVVEISKDNFEKLDVPEDVVKILYDAIGSTDLSGFNPLNYDELEE